MHCKASLKHTPSEGGSDCWTAFLTLRPSQVQVPSHFVLKNKKIPESTKWSTQVFGARNGMTACDGCALHADGSTTHLFHKSVPVSPLFAKNSSLNCFLDAQTLLGFKSHFLQKKKPRQAKAYLGFLVREMGLEPIRRGHTHLKRACLPIPALAHI